MKKNHIVGIVAFLLLAVAFFFINREGRIVSMLITSHYGYEDVLAKDIQKKIGFHDYNHFVTNISNNVRSAHFAAITDDGQTVNVFAEFTITLISRSLDKLVIETSNDPRSESGRENMMQGSGNYQVIIGDGYEWTKRVVVGP